LFAALAAVAWRRLGGAEQEFMKMVHARARRRMTRGLKRKPMALIKRLRKAKKGELPAAVLCNATHCAIDIRTYTLTPASSCMRSGQMLRLNT
jgi:hypothetical protein